MKSKRTKEPATEKTRCRPECGTTPATAPKTIREPTERETAALRKYLAQLEAKAPLAVKVSKNGNASQLSVDYPIDGVGDVLLMEALGTVDHTFFNGILEQLANASAHDQEIDERRLNFMLSIIKGIEPRDQLEAMLAAQMAAVHIASMTFARRLGAVETVQQQDSAERAFNKLTRTFATQMEALKRYRTGGEQKVTVQHVSVAEGGQAIVGNVTHTPGQNLPDKVAAAPAPALPGPDTAPMPIIAQDKERTSTLVRRRSSK